MDGHQKGRSIEITENIPCLRALKTYFQYNLLYLNTLGSCDSHESSESFRKHFGHTTWFQFIGFLSISNFSKKLNQSVLLDSIIRTMFDPTIKKRF